MTDNSDLQEYLNVAREAAYKGGAVLLRHWRRLKEVNVKGESDLVTIADKESEEVVLGIIKGHYPNHGIIAEESGAHCAVEGCTFLWAVDPLDGTTNYAHGYPEFAVSIALLEDGEPIVGVVYEPIPELLFHATLDGGAFLNGELISVSAVSRLKEALLISGYFMSDPSTSANVSEMSRLDEVSHGVRKTGAAAVNLVDLANGSIDGFWYRGLKIWDIAAGALIVREAGGKVTNYRGKSPDWTGGEVIASNDRIHNELIEALESYEA
ncbi:Inositol-1-monophosphatase [Chlamydiales bacterium SCGC AG-110-P3]|nr:Inositol-1-monophosphatase [Chlamydiales bacterium SCGC AG-110-P3]